MINEEFFQADAIHVKRSWFNHAHPFLLEKFDGNRVLVEIGKLYLIIGDGRVTNNLLYYYQNGLSFCQHEPFNFSLSFNSIDGLRDYLLVERTLCE